MTYIDNHHIESITAGYAFSAREEFGADITLVTPAGTPRSEIGKPIVLANRLIIPDGDECGHHAITIKAHNSDVIALPECHSFAFPLAKTVARDVISLYGWDKFLESKISFILQRTEVKPAEQHRKNFGHWHTHDHDKATFDLTYQFSNRMGTEFKPAGEEHDPFVLPAPTHALTRFGAEIEHRSPMNTSNESLSRTWGAFLVYPEKVLSNFVAVNRVLKPENIEAALERGRTSADKGHNSFETPIPLTKIANRFVDPEVPESLKALFPNGLRFGFHSAVHGIYSAKIEQTTEAGLVIETRSFDGQIRKTPVELSDKPTDQHRWGIQCALMDLGAHPIEPINA